MTENETNLETGMLGGSQVKIASGSDIHYHRNGIGGSGFWAIKFTYGDYDMIGTIGLEGDDLLLNSCRVVATGLSIGNTWRGDQFAPYLEKQMNELYVGNSGHASFNGVWEQDSEA